MSPPRFTYRKLSAAEFTKELGEQGMSIGAFARIFGAPISKAEKWANGSEDIPKWVPIVLTLLRLPEAHGTARMAAAAMIESDRLFPERGRFPFKGQRSLPDDFDAAGDN